ncbi:lipase family protein [Vibrio sp. MEBiC08052]|uniref:lipase family protein n=1 Tax=Vibrio sp. MEBiC08052 TaxID=1761910 RepID=UPI0007407F89|nr:hypothetical protein [Vibrio sp. MEBiC08052]KUI98902.1 hypothetical protein VRK_22320 [Vibrio sp. MEBiC08052]
MSTKQQSYEQIMVQLAGVTVESGLSTVPSLPATWKTLTTKTVFTSSLGKIQVLLAFGNVGDEVVACLSIGVPWSHMLGMYTAGFEPEAKDGLPEAVAGSAPEDAVIFSMYTSAYVWLRPVVWQLLTSLENTGAAGKPFYITGMGLGGPLAQIVALDFRPEHKGPDQQLLPWSTQPTSYVFSTGNFANSTFATYYNQTVTGAYNFRAGSLVLTVDPFPDRPVTDVPTSLPAAETFSPLGEVVYVPASVPKPYDTPWQVRDTNFYLAALGGSPQTFPATATVIPNPPAGFSQTLAFNLGGLVAQLYRQAQNPDNPNPPGLIYSFDLGESPYIAAVFETSNTLMLAFRGSLTYQEFLMMDAYSTTATTPYSDIITAGVHEVLYTPPSKGEASLVSKIKTYLQTLLSDKTRAEKSLYLIGHGFGGALANAMAADIAFNPSSENTSSLTVAKLYTFGASYFASVNLANKFQQKFGAVSYQVLRPGDDVATALQDQPYWNPVENTVALLGNLDTHDNTQHSLSRYLLLLDPSRPQPKS